MELNMDLILAIAGVVCVILFALKVLSKEQVISVDRQGKILKAAEGVHELIKDSVLLTPNKYDDALDAFLVAVIYVLKNKEQIAELSAEEKVFLKEYFIKKFKSSI